MSPLRKARSSLCVSRIVSILVCVLCICHCIRRTNPSVTRAIVIKSPNIHCKVSNLLSTAANLLFISDRKSSMRLLTSSKRFSRLFCPSSNFASLSTISLSLILGAVSTAISIEGVNIPTINQVMIMIFLMISAYHLKAHKVNKISRLLSCSFV